MNYLNDSPFPEKDFLDWTYPKRHISGANDYIDFYAKDPLSGTLKRKKISLLRFRAGRERDEMAGQIIDSILNKLHNGWSPWTPELENLGSTPLVDVCTEFETTIKYEVSRGIKKEKTKVDYLNRLLHFKQWALSKEVCVISYCTPAVVDSYLQWKLVHKGVAAKTRNTEKTFLSAFFGWCVRRHYLKENPCKGIGKLRETDKIRRPLTSSEMQRLSAWLRDNDRWFLLAVMWEYYTLIRPKELSYLRLCDISVADQTVVVPGKYSKNGKEEPVGLNGRILSLMAELGVFSSPSSYYLFGKGFRPSRERADERIFRTRWAEIREELHIPRTVHFYSLKDTGIIDLIHTEGAVIARDQARHSSIAVTNAYTKYGGRTAHEETKHFKGSL